MFLGFFVISAYQCISKLSTPFQMFWSKWMCWYASTHFWGHFNKWPFTEIYHRRQWAGGVKSSTPMGSHLLGGSQIYWNADILIRVDKKKLLFAPKHLEVLKRVVYLPIWRNDRKTFHLRTVISWLILLFRLFPPAGVDDEAFYPSPSLLWAYMSKRWKGNVINQRYHNQWKKQKVNKWITNIKLG